MALDADVDVIPISWMWRGNREVAWLVSALPRSCMFLHHDPAYLPHSALEANMWRKQNG